MGAEGASWSCFFQRWLTCTWLCLSPLRQRPGQAAFSYYKGGGHCRPVSTMGLKYSTHLVFSQLGLAQKTRHLSPSPMPGCSGLGMNGLQEGSHQLVMWWEGPAHCHSRATECHVGGTLRQHRAVSMLRLAYLCHGDASPQRSSPEGPGAGSTCPECNPPGAVSSKLRTGT